MASGPDGGRLHWQAGGPAGEVGLQVDERRRNDKSLVASWYLLMDDPYMVYGEVPLPDGTTQRMTEVPIPVR